MKFGGLNLYTTTMYHVNKDFSTPPNTHTYIYMYKIMKYIFIALYGKRAAREINLYTTASFKSVFSLLILPLFFGILGAHPKSFFRWEGKMLDNTMINERPIFYTDDSAFKPLRRNQCSVNLFVHIAHISTYFYILIVRSHVIIITE